MTSPTPRTTTLDAQDNSQTSHATRGGISGALGIVTSLALALVSLVVWADTHERDPQDEAAMDAIAATTATEGVPVYITDPTGEELVWRARGRISLLPPWKPSPDEASFVALARDSSRLPAVVHQTDAGDLIERPPWVARGYGDVNPPARPPTLLDALSRAEVFIAKPEGEARPCAQWRAPSWHCGPKPWNRVGPETITIQGQPETCMWLHPSDEGELVIHWPALAAPATLEGRIGLSDQAAQTPGGAAIQFTVEVNGELALKRTHPNKGGWSAIRAPVPAIDGEPQASLTLRVSAPRTGRRHFCMDARVTPQEAAP